MPSVREASMRTGAFQRAALERRFVEAIVDRGSSWRYVVPAVDAVFLQRSFNTPESPADLKKLTSEHKSARKVHNRQHREVTATPNIMRGIKHPQGCAELHKAAQGSSDQVSAPSVCRAVPQRAHASRFASKANT